MAAIKTYTLRNLSDSDVTLNKITFANDGGIAHTANLSNFGGNLSGATAFTDNTTEITNATSNYVWDSSPVQTVFVGEHTEIQPLLHILDNPNAYDTTVGDQFGKSIAISGNYAIVGAPGEDDAGGTDSGKAYIFDVTTGALLYTLDNPNSNDTSATDTFGLSVAISGNYAVVGAPGEVGVGGEVELVELGTAGSGYSQGLTATISPPPSGTNATVDVAVNPSGGAITSYTVTNVGSGYTSAPTVTLIKPSNAVTNATFTTSTANIEVVSATGIYVGMQASSTNITGAQTVINIAGTTITLSTVPNGNGTGESVTFSDEGAGGIPGTVLITATPSTDSGAAYIYDITSFPTSPATIVSATHVLTNPNAYDTSAFDLFGRYVAVSGNNAIIGAWAEDDAPSNSSGKAYIYNVTTGSLVHTLDNPNAFGTSAGDYFGKGVAISGNNAIIGAPGEGDAGGTNSGKAYIYNVTTGAVIYTLNNPTAFGTSADDGFGNAVSISDNYAIVGAPFEDDAGGLSSGKAYIFNVGTGALFRTLTNPNDYDTSAGDEFGHSVAISGSYAIVSAWNESVGAAKAYVFNIATGLLLYSLDNPNPYGSPSTDGFSSNVAISGNYAMVDAFIEGDAGGTNSGKAYIYDVTASGPTTNYTYEYYAILEPDDDISRIRPDWLVSLNGYDNGQYVVAATSATWIQVSALANNATTIGDFVNFTTSTILLEVISTAGITIGDRAYGNGYPDVGSISTVNNIINSTTLEMSDPPSSTPAVGQSITFYSTTPVGTLSSGSSITFTLTYDPLTSSPGTYYGNVSFHAIVNGAPAIRPITNRVVLYVSVPPPPPEPPIIPPEIEPIVSGGATNDPITSTTVTTSPTVNPTVYVVPTSDGGGDGGYVADPDQLGLDDGGMTATDPATDVAATADAVDAEAGAASAAAEAAAEAASQGVDVGADVSAGFGSDVGGGTSGTNNGNDGNS